MTRVRLAWDSKRTVARVEGKYERVRSADPYHTSRWTKLSRAYRIMHPLCENCRKNGIIEPATCVDHIVPWPLCADQFFDERNLQALCDKCNHDKGQRDKKIIAEWKRNHEQND